MAEQTELKTLTIGDKVYDASTITEMGVNIINDVKKVDQELAHIGLQKSIAELAKVKLMEELQKETEKFTEIESTEKTEEAK
jgi:hypothetical protein